MSAKAIALLRRLRGRGLRVWREGDELRWRGSELAMTPALRQELERCEAELLALLADVAGELELPKAPRDRDLPLSFAQRRLWFLDLTGEFSRAYNLPMHLRLRGELDHGALREALDGLLARHEILRTTINAAGEGEARQMIQAPMRAKLELVERRPHEPEGDAITALVEAQERRGFDLGSELPWRASLLRLSAEDHLLSFVFHHCAFDGWSAAVFARELSALYAGARSGIAARLPRLDVQYADYAHWQRARLTGERLRKLSSYWCERLREAPAVELPFARSRPRRSAHRGATARFALPPATSRALEGLARAEGVTLNTALLATFKLLLHGYTGQGRISVGSPVAGREHPKLAELIGFFVNPLVLSTEIAGAASFIELLARVQETVVGALEHQEMPFDLLVRELQPRRALNRHPLFQIMFVVQDPRAMAPSFDLPGLEVESLGTSGVSETAARLDQEWHLWLDDGRLHGVVAYDRELFEAEDLERMVADFVALVAGVVEAPGAAPASLLPRSVLDFTRSEATVTATRSILDLFRAQVARHPERSALALGDANLSYAELAHRSGQLARILRAHGVGPERIVGLCVERSFAMIVALLAILEAGGAYLPLDPELPAQRLAFMIDDAGAELVVTRGQLWRELCASASAGVELESIAWLDVDGSQDPGEDPADDPPTEPEQLAYVIYTSGSTGRPKGVALEHAGLVNLAHAQRELFEIDGRSRVLQFASIGFDAATWEWVMALSWGACLCLLPPGRARSGELGVELRRLELSHATLPPAVLPSLDPDELPTLATLILAGEACPPELAARWARGRRLWNAYGPTETTVCATAGAYDPSRPEFPIGVELPGVIVRVLDDQLRPVPEGKVGELCIGGVALARGYLGRPELTGRAFVADPLADEPGARLYRSGDLGRRRPDGALEFIGRKDRQVKLRGFRVELGEVEATLHEQPGVAQAAALVHEPRPGDKRLLAYLVLADDEGSVGAAETTAEQQVERWRRLSDEHAYDGDDEVDPFLDTTGWRSSYTGEPIPDEHMRAWADDIAGRIRALRPFRVREIGCGSGMILLRLAPHCERYFASDLSTASIDRLRRRLAAAPGDYTQVELRRAEAVEPDGSVISRVDTVVLNSVVQYFPSLDYLLRVIEAAVEQVGAGGRIFIGDVRNHRLLELFHSDVQSQRAPADTRAGQLRRRVDAAVAGETELLVDPMFFAALSRRFDQVEAVEIALESGEFANEMSAFRYHVTIHVGRGSTPGEADEPRAWSEGGPLELEDIAECLRGNDAPRIGFRNLRNRRLAAACAARAWLARAGDEQACDGLHHARALAGDAGVEPDELRSLGRELGYEVELCWSNRTPGAIDAAFYRPGHRLAPPMLTEVDPRAWSTYANDPLRAAAQRRRLDGLRARLAEVLPPYMVPGRLIPVDALPLTHNGKVDYASLAQGDRGRAEASEVPNTPRERAMCELFAEVLATSPVAPDDDFFALGGHSLLAIELVARVRQRFGRALALPELFEKPTPRGLARRVFGPAKQGARQVADEAELNELRRGLELEPAIAPDATPPPGLWRRPLLTGATGFVGAFLLRDLLELDEVDRVYCLVRAEDPTQGMRRIAANLASLGLWRAKLRRRIVPMPGELAAPGLGLSTAGRAELVENCDLILHNGAAVNFFLRYGDLEAANVDGTRELLRLACAGEAKPFHYVSTLGVFEGLARSLAAEGARRELGEAGSPPLFSSRYSTGYAQSKAVAEGLVEVARRRGLPASIYRPAAVLGDTKNGCCSRREFMVDLIAKGAAHGLLPDFDLANYMIPVDVVSRFIVEAARRPRLVGRNYHLMGSRNVSMAELAACLATMGHRVRSVPAERFVDLALAEGAPPEMRDLVPLFELEASLGVCMGAVAFKRTNYIEGLGVCGRNDHEVDDRYLLRCLRHLIR